MTCEYHLDLIHYFEVILILDSFSFNWSFHPNHCSHSGFKPNAFKKINETFIWLEVSHLGRAIKKLINVKIVFRLLGWLH